MLQRRIETNDLLQLYFIKYIYQILFFLWKICVNSMTSLADTFIMDDDTKYYLPDRWR